MRTDGEILIFIIPLFDPTVADSVKHDILDSIEGAFECGLAGREALEAAMGAIKLEPGESHIWRSGVQIIADKHERLDVNSVPAGPIYDNLPTAIDELAELGARIAYEIDRLQTVPSEVTT